MTDINKLINRVSQGVDPEEVLASAETTEVLSPDAGGLVPWAEIDQDLVKLEQSVYALRKTLKRRSVNNVLTSDLRQVLLDLDMLVGRIWDGQESATIGNLIAKAGRLIRGLSRG